MAAMGSSASDFNTLKKSLARRIRRLHSATSTAPAPAEDSSKFNGSPSWDISARDISASPRITSGGARFASDAMRNSNTSKSFPTA